VTSWIKGDLTLNDNSDIALDVDDDNENENSSPHKDYLSEGQGSIGRTGISSTFSLVCHARAKAKMSWVWTHFKAMPANCTHVFCHLCGT
jgi:hypothetical protein